MNLRKYIYHQVDILGSFFILLQYHQNVALEILVLERGAVGSKQHILISSLLIGHGLVEECGRCET